MVATRELVSDLVFVITSPISGVEEALEEASKLSKSWLKIASLYRVHGTPYLLPNGSKKELLMTADAYFRSGADSSVTFMALMNKYSAHLNDALQNQNAALMSLLATMIIMSVLSFLVILGIPPITPILFLSLLPMIHYYQIELVKYDYVKPTLSGMAGLGASLVISWLRHANSLFIPYLIMGFTTGFALLYVPQFIRFINDYRGMVSKVMKSFNDLLITSSPMPPGTRTIVERELRVVWGFAQSVGSRDVVERVNMVVDEFLRFVRHNVRSGFLYGPFVVVPYVFILLTTTLLMHMAISISTPLPVILNPTILTSTLLPLSITTAILTGKAIHSVGLGISLIPIFILVMVSFV